MSGRTILFLGCVVTVSALIAAGCQRSAPTDDSEAAIVGIDQASVRVSGPYAHENLSVFLIHSDRQDERDFITLDQGLKEGSVTVTEKAQEQVSELMIDNQADRPLFLQEGDRLRGGKQDRTIIASMVVPPKSGQMPLPAFCIEPGRWRPSTNGNAFSATANAALASKPVRLAATFAKDQSQVWDSVRAEKEAAVAYLRAPNTTTSLNEAFDSPQVKKVSDELAGALSDILQNHPDAVGVAIVVNGTIEETDVYPNHQLLVKLYPRLLQSYALAVAGRTGEDKAAKPVSVDDVAQFMKAGGKKTVERTDQINLSNCRQVSLFENKVQCATDYKGTLVHHQVFKKD